MCTYRQNLVFAMKRKAGQRVMGIPKCINVALKI